jgi:hypothetical protein
MKFRKQSTTGRGPDLTCQSNGKGVTFMSQTGMDTWVIKVTGEENRDDT